MWKKRLVLKIFKKGDLCDCNPWRGVTLLPIISKIFCRVLLKWNKKGVDKSFERSRLDLDQIEALLNRSLY